MNKYLPITFILFVISFHFTHAESVSGGLDPNQNFQFSSGRVVGGSGDRFLGSTANGISAGVLNNTLNPNMPEYDEANGSSGREYKAGSSESTGNTGGAVGLATGISLISIGTPMLFSIFPSVVAAGADLVSKGSQELAQGAADLGSAEQNGGQREMLTMDEGYGMGSGVSQAGSGSGNRGLSNANLDAIREQVMTPELQQKLVERGINSDDFLNQLVSGALGDPSSVLSAVGDFTQFSDADLQQGQALASQSFEDLMQKRDGLLIDETADKGEESQGGGMLAMGTQDKAHDDGVEGDAGKLASDRQSSAQAGPLSARDGKVTSKEQTMAKSNVNMGQLLNRFKKKDKDLSKGVSESKLLERGIYKPRHGENIFVRAKKFYQSFGKWRSFSRVAHR